MRNPDALVKVSVGMGKNTLRNQIWYKIIDKLNKEKIDYVVVGATALVIHGLPRSTLDIDIYIPARAEMLNKLFLVAHKLRLQSAQEDILNLSHLPNLYVNQWLCFSYRGQDILDVFLAEEQEFQRLLKNSQVKKDGNFLVRIASLKDIIRMKKSSARPIDLADLELIKEYKKYRKNYK